MGTPRTVGEATGPFVLSEFRGEVVRWQRRRGAGSWEDIAVLNDSYSETPATAGLWQYRAVVQQASCTEATSEAGSAVVAPVSLGGAVQGASLTIATGMSTGDLSLHDSVGDVRRWQRRHGEGAWEDVSSTSATFSDTPAATGIWSYRAVVQSGICAEAASEAWTVEVKRALAVSCDADAQCYSEHCECTDEDCATKLCAAEECECRIYSVAASACSSTAMPDGASDPEDCAADGEACWDGRCARNLGEPCFSDQECGSNACECVDAACLAGSKQCASLDCKCGFSSDGESCGGTVLDGTDPDADCPGENDACYSGACKNDLGTSCRVGANCASGQCECLDSACSTRSCAAASCVCRFGATCDTNLPDGASDPGDCAAAGSACFGGACLWQDGRSCTSDSDCLHGHCECTSSGCALRICSAVSCPCQHNITGDSLCDGPLADGIDPMQRCAASQACYSGGCKKKNGEPCSTNVECGRNQCECADAGCTGKKCSDIDCNCRFNAEGNNSCEGSVSDGTDDADDTCGAQTCNGSGSCNLVNGSTCTFDTACDSNKCECANTGCSSRVCSVVECACKHNSNGDALCDGPLSDGLDDPDNSCGAQSCDGTGVCHLAGGTICTTNAACESGNCECTDADCTASKKCSPVDCDCRFNVDSDSTCEGVLNHGRDDFENSCGGQTCNGFGSCHYSNGVMCYDNQQCESNHCECKDAYCLSKICSSVDCICRYNADGYSPCDGYISHGYDDAENSCGAQTCDGAGGCHLGPGTTCTSDSTCQSGFCECSTGDAKCTYRACAAENCVCRYGVAGACTTALTDGTKDPQDCDGTRACYGGACFTDYGAVCSADSDCASGNCECADNKCVTKKCSRVDCDCGYNSNGDSTCDGQIADGYDDAEDSCGPLTCTGYGRCKVVNGASCGSDADCETDCACTNSGCTRSACSPVSCGCRVNADSDGTCEDDVSDGVSDGGACTGTLTCNGSGGCHLESGSSCTASADCQTNRCECAEPTCATKKCSYVECNCRYKTAGDSFCDGNISAGYPDADGACGAVGCNGAGICYRALGDSCTMNAECTTGNCECIDELCSERACAIADCDCRYGEGGACTTDLGDGVEDPEDCEGTGACFAGHCKRSDGASCATDPDCLSDNCECVDATCTARRCTSVDCPCGYDTDSDGICNGLLADGRDDPEDSCGAQSCNGAGGCNLPNASACLSDFCECADAYCSAKKCSAVDCDCAYNANGDAPCDGALAWGKDDPDNSCGDYACNGSGSCTRSIGSTCYHQYECETQACECADERCFARVCSPHYCFCKYVSAPSYACSAFILAGYSDGSQSCDAQYAHDCDGAGGCQRGYGEFCTIHSQCDSGRCIDGTCH